MPANKFSDPLTVTKVGGGRWRVAESFTFTPAKFAPVKVPKGFETDFASVPRYLWAFFPPDGQYSQAAVTHDFLYQKMKDLTWVGPKRSRKECDQIFLEAMKELGVGVWKRQVMYRAVRLFGWAH